VTRPAHPVPSGGGGEFFRAITQQHGAAFGGHDIENEAQKLPLQRVLVANATDSGGDFQQRVQVTSPAGGGWQAGNGFLGAQVEGIFGAQQ